MNDLKSHFRYNNSQRNGILLLVLIIVLFQLIYFFADFSKEVNTDLNSNKVVRFQKEIDSLKQINKNQMASLLTLGMPAKPDEKSEVAHKPGIENPVDIHGYRLLEMIGQGGGGTVWRAWQDNTQREVAIKMLPVGLETNQRAQIRFEREVEMSSRLEHPHIARIYDSGG